MCLRRFAKFVLMTSMVLTGTSLVAGYLEGGYPSPNEIVEAESRFYGVKSVVEFIADPKNEATFIVRLCGQWISLMTGFIGTHFMSWDYNDTQPGEEFSLSRLYNFFANPETPMLVTTILFGQSTFASFLFWLPTLFWRGEIPVTPTNVNIQRSSGRKCSTARTTSSVLDKIPYAFRGLMSPHGLIMVLIIISMEHAGFLLFWLASPYFTGSAFSARSSSERCIREAEMQQNFNSSESFILRSINQHPGTFEDKNNFSIP